MAGGMEQELFILSTAAYQALSYEGTNDIRVAAWKHPTRVDGEVFVEYDIQEPSAQMAAQNSRRSRFENAVLESLRAN